MMRFRTRLFISSESEDPRYGAVCGRAHLRAAVITERAINILHILHKFDPEGVCVILASSNGKTVKEALKNLKKSWLKPSAKVLDRIRISTLLYFSADEAELSHARSLQSGTVLCSTDAPESVPNQLLNQFGKNKKILIRHGNARLEFYLNI